MSYLGRCAYCDYETQAYEILERVEAELLTHAYAEYAHISDPRVVHLGDLERVAQEETRCN